MVGADHKGVTGMEVDRERDRSESPGGCAGWRRAIPEGVVERLVAEPAVRDDEVRRARALLRGPVFCPAEAVAATLVDCLVAGRLP